MLPLLPLRDIIVFPYMVLPLFVGRQKSIQAVNRAIGQTERPEIFLVAQRDAKNNDPAEKDIYEFGTIAEVSNIIRLPNGTVKVLVEGKKRARIERYVPHDEFFLVDAEEIEEVCEVTPEVEALVRSVNSTFENYVKLNKKIPPEAIMSVCLLYTSPSPRDS